MAFLTRYEEDTSNPGFGRALRDLAVRVIAPGILVWCLVTGLGLLIVDGPFKSLGKSEDGITKSLQSQRTGTLDTLTQWWSGIGNTPSIIATAFVAGLIILIVTRKWWLAVMPLIAISVQSSIFVLATWVTDRPRPYVEDHSIAKLDPAPPTSSYPSGHEAATTALYLTLLFFCLRIRNPALRGITVVLACLPPFLVGFARTYRGMHHFSDVVVGFVLGIVCAVLTWQWLRRATAHRR